MALCALCGCCGLSHTCLHSLIPRCSQRVFAGAGVLSSQQRGAGVPAAAAAAATSAGGAAAAAAVSEEEPLVLPLSELLAVRRCAEPSLPEGAGIWVSTHAIPTVRANLFTLH